MNAKLVCWQINSFDNHNNLVDTFSVEISDSMSLHIYNKYNQCKCIIFILHCFILNTTYINSSFKWNPLNPIFLTLQNCHELLQTQLTGELYLQFLTCQVSVQDFNLPACTGELLPFSKSTKVHKLNDNLMVNNSFLYSQNLNKVQVKKKNNEQLLKDPDTGSSADRRRLSPRVWRPQTRTRPRRHPLPTSSPASAAWKPPFLLSYAADSWPVLHSLPLQLLLKQIYLLVNVG